MCMYIYTFFYKNHVFSAQPGKRDRDNYRQLTMMFLNFELIWAWCSYQLCSFKEKKRCNQFIHLSNHLFILLRNSPVVLRFDGSQSPKRVGQGAFQTLNFVVLERNFFFEEGNPVVQIGGVVESVWKRGRGQLHFLRRAKGKGDVIATPSLRAVSVRRSRR